MSAERLLKEFERTAEAPSAVARFRRFILELAVHGKLVMQELADEPASDLLRRVGSRTNSNDSFGAARLGGYELPDSWLWCRVSDIGRVVGGGTPPSDQPDCFAAAGTAIAWLTPADLGQQKGKKHATHGRRDLTRRGLDSCGATVMPAGTVLFTSRAPIGYVAIAANDAATNQGFKSVVPSAAVVPDYVAVFFRAFAPQIDGMAPGTTFREVSGKIVAGLPFPLPPLAEQHRIVAKVDELMALCDQLEAGRTEREARRDALHAAALQRLMASDGDVKSGAADVRFFLDLSQRLITKPGHLVTVRAAILDLAVQGRLVPRDRRSWSHTTLGKACSKITDGTHRTPTYIESGVPFVSVKDFSSGHLNFAFTRHISREEHSRLVQRCRPERGDILIGRIGTLGKPVVVDTDREFSLFVSVGLLKPRRDIVTPEYLRAFLDSPTAFAAFERIKVGGGTHTNKLNLADLQDLALSLPPLAEQIRIVAKVVQLMAVCDELEASLASAKDGRVRLLEALLHEALNGAKLPQTFEVGGKLNGLDMAVSSRP